MLALLHKYGIKNEKFIKTLNNNDNDYINTFIEKISSQSILVSKKLISFDIWLVELWNIYSESCKVIGSFITKRINCTKLNNSQIICVENNNNNTIFIFNLF